MKATERHRTALLTVLLLLALTLNVSCAALKKFSKSSDKSAKVEDEGPMPVYYDFNDVLVPAELSIDKKSSFVYSTPSFAAGVLVLNGYVDADSLVAFFKENMAKDGWFLRSSFRYRRTILVYQKGNRDCLITITDELTKTHVEIWVAQAVIEESDTEKGS